MARPVVGRPPAAAGAPVVSPGPWWWWSWSSRRRDRTTTRIDVAVARCSRRRRRWPVVLTVASWTSTVPAGVPAGTVPLKRRMTDCPTARSPTRARRRRARRPCTPGGSVSAATAIPLPGPVGAADTELPVARRWRRTTSGRDLGAVVGDRHGEAGDGAGRDLVLVGRDVDGDVAGPLHRRGRLGDCRSPARGRRPSCSIEATSVSTVPNATAGSTSAVTVIEPAAPGRDRADGARDDGCPLIVHPSAGRGDQPGRQRVGDDDVGGRRRPVVAVARCSYIDRRAVGHGGRSGLGDREVGDDAAAWSSTVASLSAGTLVEAAGAGEAGVGHASSRPGRCRRPASPWPSRRPRCGRGCTTPPARPRPRLVELARAPGSASNETNVVPGGIGSERLALGATVGPLLTSVSRYSSGCPATGSAVTSSLVSVTSAWAIASTVAVAVLSVGIGIVGRRRHRRRVVERAGRQRVGDAEHQLERRRRRRRRGRRWRT